MKCACHQGRCPHNADYFPALRLRGVHTGEMVLGLPTCHECSKAVPILHLVPPEQFWMVKKELKKMGQYVTCLGELDLVWIDVDLPEVSSVRKALGVK
jgi:hypothetical protein